jgi:hypothetical protein
MSVAEKKTTVEDLNRMYQDAKSADKEQFAEFRSAILMIAGDHYSKRMSEWWNRSRTTQQTSENYKMRITKNWIHRAHRLYMKNILNKSPGTTFTPRNPLELQDTKDAELNESVWEYLKDKVKFKAKIREWVSDFCGPGECVAKLFFDPNRGYLKGYEGAVDEMEQPVVDEMGQQVPDKEKPVMSGEMVFERIFPQNLFRDPNARNMLDAKWIGIEKMENAKELRKLYKDDPRKQKMIQESVEEFVVFDSNKNGYSREKDMALVLEYYYRPCLLYPNGYFYIATKSGVLEEGELPKGIFPIVWKGFDEHNSKARASGMVKIARPWQAEINRASSQIAMHQVTISEDKILYQAGTKVAQGALLPGVRGLTYQGAPPTILPGRVGDQYFTYIDRQYAEMDRALMLDELDRTKMNEMDPMALMFKDMSQQQDFELYSSKFGEFLVEITEKALDLARFYLPDDEVIAAVGKSEVINMAEFRKTTPLCHAVKVTEQNDTISTKMGSQMMFNHILQYVGTQLSREDIGKMIMNMPFGNWKDSFKDFTMDETNVKNDFLAIERGEQPQVSPKDNSEYVLKKVASRKKERDYFLLDPRVQSLYDQYEQYHEQKIAAEAAALKQAQAQFIPTGGAMIACDMYVPNEDPNKAPKRVRVPYQALEALLKQLEQQGSSLDAMEKMNQGQLAEMAQMLMQQGGGNPQQQQQMAM